MNYTQTFNEPTIIMCVSAESLSSARRVTRYFLDAFEIKETKPTIANGLLLEQLLKMPK